MIQVEGVLHPVRSVKHGAYWRLLLPGLHNITVTAAGYLPQTKFKVNVTNENLTTVRVLDSIKGNLLKNTRGNHYRDFCFITIN